MWIYYCTTGLKGGNTTTCFAVCEQNNRWAATNHWWTKRSDIHGYWSWCTIVIYLVVCGLKSYWQSLYFMQLQLINYSNWNLSDWWNCAYWNHAKWGVCVYWPYGYTLLWSIYSYLFPLLNSKLSFFLLKIQEVFIYLGKSYFFGYICQISSPTLWFLSSVLHGIFQCNVAQFIKCFLYS